MPVITLLAKGGFAMIPLGICSLLVLAVTLERIWTLSRLSKVPHELIRRAQEYLAQGQSQAATDLLRADDSAFARVASAGLSSAKGSKDALSDSLTLACDDELAAAQSPLGIVGTIGTIGVYIGLFGAVLGIIQVFARLQASQASAEMGTGLANAYGGLTEVLIATATGLMVSIIAVIAFNWLNAAVDGFRLKLERFATEWSHFIVEHRGNAAPAPVAVEQGQ
jgi:biopolymer transport protein ExbB